MTSTTKTSEAHLTEAILTIHNEVQSAFDYISSTAAKESTELGKSSAMLYIESLRIKVPLKLSLEIEQKTLPVIPKTLVSPEKIRAILAKRGGFVIERNDAKKTGLCSKVKVAFNPSDIVTTKTAAAKAKVEKADSENMWGEIEITFVPLKRE